MSQLQPQPSSNFLGDLAHDAAVEGATGIEVWLAKKGFGFARKALKRRQVIQAWRRSPQLQACQEGPDAVDTHALLREKQKALYKKAVRFLQNTAATEKTRYLRMHALFYYAYTVSDARTDGQKRNIRSLVTRLIDLVEREAAVILSPEHARWLRLARMLDQLFNEARIDREMRTYEIKEAIRYSGSFAENIDNIPPPTVQKGNLFDFRAGIVKFSGRTKELAALEAFLQDERSVLWWGVIGQGGTSKSRLALEAYQRCNDARPQQWKAVFIDKETLAKPWQHNYMYPMNLLLVIDYASTKTEALNGFMEALLLTQSNLFRKIRLLLLEREGYNEKLNQSPPWLPTKHLRACFRQTERSLLCAFSAGRGINRRHHKGIE